MRLKASFVCLTAAMFVASLVGPNGLAMADGPVNFNTMMDLSDYIEIRYERAFFNRRSGQLSRNVIVTNTSDQEIRCPLVLVINSISAEGVTVQNAAGQSPGGDPFVDLSNQVGDDGQLQPGESTLPFKLIFDNPNRRRFRFQTECLGILVFAPPPAPVLDAHTTMTRESQVTISGIASDGTSVEVSGPEGVFDVSVTEEGVFEASVPLTPNSVNRLFFTTVGPTDVRGPPAATDVTQDSQAPNLLIQFPAADAELTTATTEVAGTVGDLLSGFMGLSVTVNGISAAVDVGIGTNGTFFAQDVPLTSGMPTVIQATATDELGNSVTEQITVTRIDVPSGAPRMVVVSGNGQEGEIETFLPEPIVVRVDSGDGTPIENKIVTFRVTRSDGRLTTVQSGEGALVLQSRTDSNGETRALWRLGSDAGFGNNRIEVAAADIAGSAFFCATANPASAEQINIGSGNNQRAEAGGPAPEPLRVWVSDSCNGVSGIPVTFTVTQGGGKVNGEDSTVVNTSDTGHAQVDFTLGPDGGNNRIVADIPNNLGNPAEFVVFGVVRDESQPTTLSGVVLDNATRPIEGAACSLILNGQSEGMISTDVNGQFLFLDLPAGRAKLHVNGLTATGLNGESIDLGSFPPLSFDLVLVPNAANSLPAPVALPPLELTNMVDFDNTQDVELTVDGIDLLKMIVKAGSVTLADGSVPSPANPIELSLNQVHTDDVPMPMPDGAAPPFTWTLQPAGTHFDPPVEVHFPNMSGLAPGSIGYFLSFNHDTNRFEIIAQGSVSEDGSTIVSDSGSGITVAGWGGICPPYSVTADCESCTVAISGAPGGAVFINEPVQLTASGKPSGGNFTWRSSEISPTGTEPSFTTQFQTPGMKDITVIYTCPGEAEPVEDTIQINVIECTVEAELLSAPPVGDKAIVTFFATGSPPGGQFMWNASQGDPQGGINGQNFQIEADCDTSDLKVTVKYVCESEQGQGFTTEVSTCDVYDIDCTDGSVILIRPAIKFTKDIICADTCDGATSIVTLANFTLPSGDSVNWSFVDETQGALIESTGPLQAEITHDGSDRSGPITVRASLASNGATIAEGVMAIRAKPVDVTSTTEGSPLDYGSSFTHTLSSSGGTLEDLVVSKEVMILRNDFSIGIDDVPVGEVVSILDDSNEMIDTISVSSSNIDINSVVSAQSLPAMLDMLQTLQWFCTDCAEWRPFAVDVDVKLTLDEDIDNTLIVTTENNGASIVEPYSGPSP